VKTVQNQPKISHFFNRTAFGTAAAHLARLLYEKIIQTNARLTATAHIACPP
jgi:hypothetical protein